MPDIGDLAITCESQSVDLICCTEGFQNIRWFKETNEGKWAEVIQTSMMYMPPDDNNQTLRIVYPLVKYHKAKYMCVAQDQYDQTINNTIRLDVRGKVEINFNVSFSTTILNVFTSYRA